MLFTLPHLDERDVAVVGRVKELHFGILTRHKQVPRSRLQQGGRSRGPGQLAGRQRTEPQHAGLYLRSDKSSRDSGRAWLGAPIVVGITCQRNPCPHIQSPILVQSDISLSLYLHRRRVYHPDGVVGLRDEVPRWVLWARKQTRQGTSQPGKEVARPCLDVPDDHHPLLAAGEQVDAIVAVVRGGKWST